MSSLTAISKRRFGTIRSLHAKKERQATGMTLLEGEKLIGEAIRDGIRMESVVATPEFWTRRSDLIHTLAASGVPTWIASDKQMEMLASTEHPGGVLAVAYKPAWQEELFWQKDQTQFLGLLAAGIQDPGNMGTMVRTLAAAGGSGLWSARGNVEATAPKTIRASAGAVFRLPVFENAEILPLLKRCRDLGIQACAAVPKGGQTYTTVNFLAPTLLVLGGEGGGLEKSVIEACDHTVQIPMPGGMESLNVAAASAVLIYEALRQRRMVALTKRRNQA